MKFTVTFKTPDVVECEAYSQIVDNYLMLTYPNEDVFREDLKEEDYEKIDELWEEEQKKINKWVKYGELVTIEFDTDKGTATVQETK